MSSSLLKMQELVTERTGRIESDLARRAEEQHKELQQTFEQWKVCGSCAWLKYSCIIVC